MIKIKKSQMHLMSSVHLLVICIDSLYPQVFQILFSILTVMIQVWPWLRSKCYFLQRKRGGFIFRFRDSGLSKNLSFIYPPPPPPSSLSFFLSSNSLISSIPNVLVPFNNVFSSCFAFLGVQLLWWEQNRGKKQLR